MSLWNSILSAQENVKAIRPCSQHFFPGKLPRKADLSGNKKLPGIREQHVNKKLPEIEEYHINEKTPLERGVARALTAGLILYEKIIWKCLIEECFVCFFLSLIIADIF